MENRDMQYKLAAGWFVLAIVLLMILMSFVMKAGINTDFSDFVHHPGPEGWAFLCWQLSSYVLLGVGVLYVDAAVFRWFNVLTFGAATLFMLAHQVGHMREGMVYGLTGVLDVVHHVVGALMTWQAWHWARATGGRLAVNGGRVSS